MLKMAPSFDCAVSSLLCPEEESLVFDDDGVNNVVLDERLQPRNYQTNKRNRNFHEEEILNGFPMQSDECLALMIHKECDHLPAYDYLERLKNRDLDLNARQEAVDWIHKAHSYFRFGPLCLYLSINYLDRFLSAYKLPAKAWMMQLLAIACLSLASKVDEAEVPFCQDLQVVESKFIFEARTIQRMELLVLNTLGWRMHAVTPFSFVDSFLKKLVGDQINQRLSITKAIQLILRMIEGIDFLEFKPSEIAAAVAIYVSGETQAVNTEDAILVLSDDNINKERILKCVELVNEFVSMRGYTKVPESPIAVLDVSCFSYKTDDTAIGSCTNSIQNSPVAKRTKIADH